MPAMPQPDEETLTRRLSEWLTAHADFILPPEQAWQSGVYMVLDAVFSSRARYHAVVVPMLRRLKIRRPVLRDEPGLTFTAFIEDVDSFTDDTDAPNRWVALNRKFDRYSQAALNMQEISGRTKTEVAYDVCVFLRENELETLADLHDCTPDQLEYLIAHRLRQKVHGIGPRLADFLLMRFGQTDRIKADKWMERFFAGLSDWTPCGNNPDDVAILRRVIGTVADEHGLTATQVDSVIWRYESGTGAQGTR